MFDCCLALQVIDGKPLYVGLAEKKEDREARLRERYTAPPMFGGKGLNVWMIDAGRLFSPFIVSLEVGANVQE